MHNHILIKEVILFILPLFIAGLLHHFWVIKYNLFAFLAKPVDFGLTIGEKRLFGDSKTFRGFFVMTIATGVFMLPISSLLNIPLRLNAFILGAMLGLGYSLGELPNSFLKRWLGIKEGDSASGFLGVLFYFIDQTDSIIGALIFLTFAYSPSVTLIATLLLIGTLLHMLVDMTLYKFGYKRALKKSKDMQSSLDYTD